MSRRLLLTTCSLLCATTPLALGLPSLSPSSPFSSSTNSDFAAKCLAFTPTAIIPNATLNRLEYLPAGTNLALPYGDASCNRPSQVVAGTDGVCRIALYVPTSGRSGFHFEIWMPEGWGGRTLATGNGGVDGCIKYEDIAYGAANGFSRTIGFGTNNGHNGTSGTAFYQNEDVVIDFSWRALHKSVEIGRRLTAQFYHSPPQKSYYIGCSLGGRQGIGAASRFPTDFDGIVAGAPAVDFNALYSWRASFFPITGSVSSKSPGFVPSSIWKTIVHDEVLRQCDAALDGVADGIIEDPELCNFNASTLLCSGDGNTTTTANCLTSAQVTTLKTIYSDYRYPTTDTLLYPRPNPGSELLASDGLYAGRAYGPSVDWFRYAVLSNPNWDPASYTTVDAAVAVKANPGGIESWPSSEDLKPFRERGGRIVSFHGQQDQQISSFNSARFWERLAGAAAGGKKGRGEKVDDVDAYYRLFRIPGMNHCAGGPGAWTVGQGGSNAAYAVPFDKEHNVLATVVEWVEKGVAPDSIVGTKFVDDAAASSSGGGNVTVAYQHRHCRYPLRSTYRGQGDPLVIDSWECARV